MLPPFGVVLVVAWLLTIVGLSTSEHPVNNINDVVPAERVLQLPSCSVSHFKFGCRG
jgi:hypothetical protein